MVDQGSGSVIDPSVRVGVDRTKPVGDGLKLLGRPLQHKSGKRASLTFQDPPK